MRARHAHSLKAVTVSVESTSRLVTVWSTFIFSGMPAAEDRPNLRSMREIFAPDHLLLADAVALFRARAHTHMGGSAHLSFTVGGLSVAGGLHGFIKTGSKMSLGAGGGLGALLIGSGVLITQGQDLEGHGLALGSSGALGAAMAARFAKTRVMMPAGGMAIVGLLSAAYHGKKFREWAE